MIAIEIMRSNEKISLRKALHYSGLSSCTYYYYEPSPRIIKPDPFIVGKTKEIALERPSYGTRRMAVMLERELNIPINRKRMQRIFRILNWIEPLARAL